MPELEKPADSSKRSAKPFPWWCPKCRKKEVGPVTIAYRSEVLHDGTLHTVDVPQLVIAQCGNCGERVFHNQSEEQIDRAVRSHLRLLSPDNIRSARLAFGLNEKSLADRLGVPEDTISCWEEGQEIQSRPMDNLLRVFFALPQVRSVLSGPTQDPNLGITVSLDQAPSV